jgi:lysophospholipase L1-like esterase
MTAPQDAGIVRRILAITATLLVAAAGLVPGTAASAAPARPVRRAFPPVRPTKVLILGDSVPLGAAPYFGPALPGRDVTVDAKVNRTTGEGADILAGLGSDWDVVVIMLGHNDGASPSVYQPPAIRMLDQLAKVPRVIWLSLHEVRPEYVGVNAFLRDQATRRPNMRVADWNAVASANPGAVAADGLHLDGQGGQLMAHLVADQVTLAEHEQADALGRYLDGLARQRKAAAQKLLLETMAANKAKADLLRAQAVAQAKARAAERARVRAHEKAVRDELARAATKKRKAAERAQLAAIKRHERAVIAAEDAAKSSAKATAKSSHESRVAEVLFGGAILALLVVAFLIIRWARARREHEDELATS